MDVGLAAEPRHLALGVVAVPLLGGGDGLVAGELVFEEVSGLAVAERVQRTHAAIVPEERLRFFDEALVEHRGGAAVDTFVEGLAVGVETEAEDAEPGEGVAAVLPKLGHGAASGEADFDGADELSGIVGVNSFGGRAIHARQDAMKIGGSAFGFPPAEVGPEGFGALGTGEEAVD